MKNCIFYVRQQARTVFKYAPDFTENVLSGAVSLDDAYKTAKTACEPRGSSS
jgi:hypothetical protein